MRKRHLIADWQFTTSNIWLANMTITASFVIAILTGGLTNGRLWIFQMLRNRRINAIHFTITAGPTNCYSIILEITENHTPFGGRNIVLAVIITPLSVKNILTLLLGCKYSEIVESIPFKSKNKTRPKHCLSNIYRVQLCIRIVFGCNISTMIAIAHVKLFIENNLPPVKTWGKKVQQAHQNIELQRKFIDSIVKTPFRFSSASIEYDGCILWVNKYVSARSYDVLWKFCKFTVL